MGLILLYTMSQILHMLQRYIFADYTGTFLADM